MELESTTSFLNIDDLVKPISDGNPVGEHLRYKGEYDQIEEFRKEDDPNLPQGVWETDLKTASWNGVFDLTVDAIANRSKDLQLAAWLLESLIYIGGFSGVVEGITLIYKLCTTYWENLHPVIEEDDIEFRISPFLWINTVLAEKLKTIPITKPDDEDCHSFTFLEWEKTVHLETLAKQSASARKKLDDERIYTKAVFKKSASLTPLEFFVQLSSTTDKALKIAGELSSFLDEKCGDTSPSLERFKKALAEIKTQINLLIGKQTNQSHMDNDRQSPGSNRTVRSVSKTLQFDSGHQIKSREEAFFLLAEIAEYLTDIDPHSPVPYLVKRAVSWGSMSLSELLTELLKDGQNLQQVYSLLGIQE
ncbi:type VI secretion system protein TssA [bacterium]|nr:type VI secretion system protein TssA [bacterium]